jgi:hypothetical protein
MKKLIGLSALAFLAACQSTGPALQRATAMQIGGNTDPNDVQVSNVVRRMNDVSWTADTKNGHYSCTADDNVRRPICTKKN